MGEPTSRVSGPPLTSLGHLSHGRLAAHKVHTSTITATLVECVTVFAGETLRREIRARLADGLMVCSARVASYL